MLLLFLLLATTLQGANNVPEFVKLVSKDKQEYLVPRVYLQKQVISDLTHTTLEDDKDTPEIDIPIATGATLATIAQMLTRLGDFKISKPWNELNPAAQRATIDVMSKWLGNKSYEDLLPLLATANYMNSPYLIKLFTWELARALRPRIEKVRTASVKEQEEFLTELQGEFDAASIPAKQMVLLPELSINYFLQNDEDIDRLFGLRGSKRTDIPFEVLKAHGKFNQKLLQKIYWESPNADRFVRALTFAVNNRDIKVIRSFGKLYEYPLDSFADNAMLAAMNSDNNEMILALIDNGYVIWRKALPSAASDASEALSALQYAVRNNNFKLVDELLARGAKINEEVMKVPMTRAMEEKLLKASKPSTAAPATAAAK